MKKVKFLVSCGFLILAGCGSSGGSDKASSTLKEEVEVTSNELISAYENNKLAAQQQFGEKIINLVGFYSSADSHITDTTTIEVSPLGDGPTVNFYSSVSAELNNDVIDAASKLNKGDLIQIKCSQWVDNRATFIPSLSSCGELKVLSKDGPDALLKYMKILNSHLKKGKGDAAPEDQPNSPENNIKEKDGDQIQKPDEQVDGNKKSDDGFDTLEKKSEN